jgi:RNA polymerase sigma factor (sigma-70 family)
MDTAQLGTVLRHIRRLALPPATRELTDAQLIERFAAHREEEAFTALLQRHGQLVWGVCRHVLRHDHDAEDAFQATFLVLARTAGSIRKREALASWLHGTAYRVALRARRDAAIRRTHERRGKSMPKDKPFPETVLREALALLDEEVGRLTPRQRAVFVLCSLEGKSLAEAAEQLGWKQGTVSGTLARARRQLEQRLTRRGVTLSAVLTTAALGRQAASAALPASLAQATTQGALLYAAGQPAAAALASPAAAALAEGVTKTMFLNKLKVATALLLAVGIGAGLLTRQALAAKQAGAGPANALSASAEDPKPAATEWKDKPPPAAPPEKGDQAIQVKGLVLGSDGKPCAGAQVFLWTNAVKRQADLAVQATTGADGRFSVMVKAADRDRDAKIVVRSRDQGPDWAEVARLDKGGEITLRLARDDVPINGRLIDLEGQPVSGATIEVVRLEQSDLKAWIETAKKGVSGHQQRELASAALDGPTTITTGKDGRFRLTGFGHDRVVLLRLSGANIEHCIFWVVTQAEPLRGMRVGPYGTYGATFTHHALPSKPIVGTVRDRATGKPLAGITVASSMYNNRYAKTDEKGQYRIVGAAKHDKYSVSAGSAPYLNSTRMDIADTPGLEPLTVDFDLDRGIAIMGRLTDKATGKPVRGYLTFIPLADNPNAKNYTELGKLQIIASDEAQAKGDGQFTVTAIPGPGVLCARADDEDRFLPADKIAGIKLAQPIILDGYHAVIPVNPSEKDPKSTQIEVALVPGLRMAGTVLDPDGKPLPGAHAAGLGATPKFFDRSEGKLPAADFTVSGLHAKKPRWLLFVHPEKKLGRLLKMSLDDPAPLNVRLEPLGTLTGRLVDADGKPVAGLKVIAQRSFNPGDNAELPADLQYNGQSWSKIINGEATTARDGKFRVEGLVPGVKYMLTVASGVDVLPRWIRNGLTVEAGKVNDLGEVKDKPPAPKEGKE